MHGHRDETGTISRVAPSGNWKILSGQGFQRLNAPRNSSVWVSQKMLSQQVVPNTWKFSIPTVPSVPSVPDVLSVLNVPLFLVFLMFHFSHNSYCPSIPTCPQRSHCWEQQLRSNIGIIFVKRNIRSTSDFYVTNVRDVPDVPKAPIPTILTCWLN